MSRGRPDIDLFTSALLTGRSWLEPGTVSFSSKTQEWNWLCRDPPTLAVERSTGKQCLLPAPSSFWGLTLMVSIGHGVLLMAVV